MPIDTILLAIITVECIVDMTFTVYDHRPVIKKIMKKLFKKSRRRSKPRLKVITGEREVS